MAEIRHANALYRNDGDWRFTDVTEQAGVGDTGFRAGCRASATTTTTATPTSI